MGERIEGRPLPQRPLLDEQGRPGEHEQDEGETGDDQVEPLLLSGESDGRRRRSAITYVPGDASTLADVSQPMSGLHDRTDALGELHAAGTHGHVIGLVDTTDVERGDDPEREVGTVGVDQRRRPRAATSVARPSPGSNSVSPISTESGPSQTVSSIELAQADTAG